jgi:type I restriction enzyme S subunit
MPQISIVKLSEVEKDGRFDAEFYKPEYLKIYNNLNKLKLSILGNVAFITDGQHGYFEVDEKSNIRQIVGRDINDEYNYLDRTNASKLSPKTHNKNLRSNLEEEDLVLSTVGTIGKVGVTLKETLPANINQSVCRIKINNKKEINPYFLSAFLKSKYGQLQIDKYSAGQVQIGFYLHKVRELLIPLFDSKKQERIAEVTKNSMNNFLKSKSLYKEAEEILLKELGLENYKPKHELTFSSKLSEVIDAERIDADYFQPKYKEIEKRIEGYKGGFDLVINQFKQNKSLSKKSNGYYNYIEIGDINVSTGEISYNKLDIKDVPDNGKRKLKKGDLLVSKVRPYRGAVSFIDFEEDNLLGSGAFTILQEKTDYKKEVLMVFLRTEYIKDFLLRFNCGTSYPVIKDEDILNLKIPLLPSPIQNKISSKIQESFKLRKESKELLEKAKQMVEDEIEKEAN